MMLKTTDLKDMANGKLQEQFNVALEKVIENILDEEADSGKPRKIQVDFVFKSNLEKDLIKLGVLTKVKLVPKEPVITQLEVTENYGDIQIQEVRAYIPGQRKYDLETGEILEDE